MMESWLAAGGVGACLREVKLLLHLNSAKIRLLKNYVVTQTFIRTLVLGGLYKEP